MNASYRDGEGLLPAPLDVPTQLLRGLGAAGPDVEVADHPLFRIFAGQRNSFLAVTRVDFYYGVDSAWRAPESGDVQTLARLRNGAPLVLEKRLGEGRVVLTLCKLSPDATELGPWSDLAKNPAFLVVVNELTGYLSAMRRLDDSRVVGEPVRLTVDEASFLPEMRVGRAGAAEGDAATVVPEAVDGQFVVDAPGDSRSGVWQFQLTTRDGKPESRYVAVNVPVGEGDLHLTPREDLTEMLRGVDYEFALASQFSETDDRLEGSHLSDAMLYALVAALVGEQLLAAAASYHARGQRQAA